MSHEVRKVDLPQVARYVYTSRGTIKGALEKRRVLEIEERATCVTCKVLNLIKYSGAKTNYMQVGVNHVNFSMTERSKFNTIVGRLL